MMVSIKSWEKQFAPHWIFKIDVFRATHVSCMLELLEIVITQKSQVNSPLCSRLAASKGGRKLLVTELYKTPLSQALQRTGSRQSQVTASSAI